MDDSRLMTAPARFMEQLWKGRGFGRDVEVLHTLLHEDSDVFEFHCRVGGLGRALLAVGKVWHGWEKDPEQVRIGRAWAGDRIHPGGLSSMPFGICQLIGWYSPLSEVPPDGLAAAVAQVAGRLAEGGMALVEGWIPPGEARPGWALMDSYSGSDWKLARVCVPTVNGAEACFEYQWMTARRGGEVRLETQVVRRWLHSDDAVSAAFESAGAAAELLEVDGLRIWRAVKR
jgi:hypothetical protein